jgi:3-hydroxyacyl-[acyl-carrier-protein] dehydratase
MRFCLLDRIVRLEPGHRITAVKQLRAEEEYLRDHFPRFPVMPGVLMLEALYQAGMWLVRCSDQFAYAGAVLREARNVKFTDFVEPGQVLTVEAEILKQHQDLTTLKAQGHVAGRSAVSGRLLVQRFHLGDLYPEQAVLENYTRRQMKQIFDRLCEPDATSG